MGPLFIVLEESILVSHGHTSETPCTLVHTECCARFRPRCPLIISKSLYWAWKQYFFRPVGKWDEIQVKLALKLQSRWSCFLLSLPFCFSCFRSLSTTELALLFSENFTRLRLFSPRRVKQRQATLKNSDNQDSHDVYLNRNDLGIKLFCNGQYSFERFFCNRLKAFVTYFLLWIFLTFFPIRNK